MKLNEPFALLSAKVFGVGIELTITEKGWHLQIEALVWSYKKTWDGD